MPSASAANEPERRVDPERSALLALDEGDRKAALTILMEAYGQALYRFCRQMLSDETLAEDAHQLTFVQAYEGLGRFSRGSTLRTWLFSIARHRCLDAAKSHRRRRARFLTVEAFPEPASGSAEDEDRLISKARHRALAECLGNLQAKVRSAVLLRFQEELSYPDMAKVCGERAPTLQARVARALPTLRRCLESRGQAA